MAASARRVADGTAYVCGHLDEIRADLVAGGGGVAPLLRVLDAVVQGHDVTAALDELHRALVAGGDTLGVYGNAMRNLHPLGLGPEPLEIVYRCPLGRCSARPWPQPAGALRCAIDGRDRIRETL